jgi:hypothetical protein
VGGHEGLFENGPRIDGAETQLNHDSSNRNQPSLALQILISHVFDTSLAFIQA